MGCVNPKNKSSRVDGLKKEINKFFYFSRHKKTLYQVTSANVITLKLKGVIEVYDDSVISTLDDDKIVVIGGSNQIDNLTSKVFLINCSSQEVLEVGEAPLETKEGKILFQGNTLYFVGTAVEANEHSGSLAGGPIMSYSLGSHEWRVIPPERVSKSGFYSLIENQSSLSDFDFDAINFNLNSLISPGAFLYDSRIYLVGGKIFDGNQYISSTKVFSIGVVEWDLRVEPFSLPIALENPSCVSKGHRSLIAGGKLENGNDNLDVFIFRAKKNRIEKYAKSFESKIENNYSPLVVRKDIIFLSYPKFWIAPDESNDLISYKIELVPGEDFKSVKRTFSDSPLSISAQYIQVENFTATSMRFAVKDANYVSDSNTKVIHYEQSGMIDLASTPYHVGVNLEVTANPLLFPKVSSQQQIVFELNQKTAIFHLNGHILHAEGMTLDYFELKNGPKNPKTPANWNSSITVNKVNYANWSRTITAKKYGLQPRRRMMKLLGYATGEKAMGIWLELKE